MEKFSEQKLNAIVRLYGLLDAIRARQFVHPDFLENTIKEADASPVLQEHLPEWKFILSKLKEDLSAKTPIIEFVIGLRKVELIPLFLYLIATGLAMLTSNSLLWQIQAVIAVVVFIYLAGVRLASYFLVTQPASKSVNKIVSSQPGIDQRLFNTINQLIDQVNRQLLTFEKSANTYKHFLENPDYPGLYYHGRRTFFGPRRVQSMPFPLHVVLSSTAGQVQVIMARLDEKLLSGLAKLPPEAKLQLVTITTIARQTSFTIAISPLYKSHPNLQVTLIVPDPNIKGITILTPDSAWMFDTAANWNETRFIMIRDPKQRYDLEREFSRLWQTGKLTKLKS